MKKKKKVLDIEISMVYNVYVKRNLHTMSIDTQLLIIHLLNRELVRSNHIATLGYRDDIRRAKHDFITHTKTLGTPKQRRRT